MAQTKIGIVYDSATGQMLRIIIPDDDSQLETAATVQAHESLVTVSAETYRGIAGAAALQTYVPVALVGSPVPTGGTGPAAPPAVIVDDSP